MSRDRVESTVARGLASLPVPLQRVIAGRPIRVQARTLDPEVQLALRLLEWSGWPSFDELSVDEARRELEREARVFGGRPLPVARVEELDARGRRVRLYVPFGAQPALLVYLHGGGWVLGSLDSHDQTCRFLAREASVRVLAVDYRLAPESPFPAAVDDAAAVFGWAVEHASDLGVDPARIAIGGDSAGGTLSAVVSWLAARDGTPVPALQLLIYPVCDLSQKRDSYRLFREGFLLTERQMDWYRGHYLSDPADARDPRASPLLAEDLRGVAPAYLAVANFDLLRDEALAYAERLRDAGVEVTLRLHEELVHGFANAVTIGRAAKAAMREAAAALRSV